MPVDLASVVDNIPDAETVVYNQVIFLPNQKRELAMLDKKKNRHASIPNPNNQMAVEDITKSKLSIERVAEDAGEGYKTVQRFIRLTNLVPELLDMVDEKKIAFNPAVELSYLDTNQQRDFLEAMNDTQNAPSLSLLSLCL